MSRSMIADMDDAERKRQQRERDRKAGIVQACVRVPAKRVKELREIAARMMREQEGSTS
jgi:hypothetical protein